MPDDSDHLDADSVTTSLPPEGTTPAEAGHSPTPPEGHTGLSIEGLPVLEDGIMSITNAGKEPLEQNTALARLPSFLPSLANIAADQDMESVIAQLQDARGRVNKLFEYQLQLAELMKALKETVPLYESARDRYARNQQLLETGQARIQEIGAEIHHIDNERKIASDLQSSAFHQLVEVLDQAMKSSDKEEVAHIKEQHSDLWTETLAGRLMHLEEEERGKLRQAELREGIAKLRETYRQPKEEADEDAKLMRELAKERARIECDIQDTRKLLAELARDFT